MAQTTVYTCDICKQSKSKNDLSRLEVRAEGIKIKGASSSPFGKSSLFIDICPECLRRKGFVVEVKSHEEIEQAEAQNKVTLEDRIYDFLSDMGVVFEN